MKYLVTNAASLIETLAKLYEDSSKRTLLGWIKNGRILVDGKTITRPTHLLKKDEQILIRHKEKKLPFGIKLIYEDDYILIIDKPENLLSVPKDTPNSINVLKILRNHFNCNIFAVHRIDRGTSGILLFTKSQNVCFKFKKIFEKHSITRKYLAILEGNLKEEKGVWKSYLTENENLKVYSTSEDLGKLAVTFFETLHRTKTFTFVSFSLKTGKKHQIRVQSQDAGFPVVGDKKYGSKTNPLKRVCLHAYLLEFHHPFLQKDFKFFSPIPKEFNNLGADKILKKLGFYD